MGRWLTIEAQIPPDESERLAALAACWILDTVPEPTFDGLDALVARSFRVPSACSTASSCAT